MPASPNTEQKNTQIPIRNDEQPVLKDPVSAMIRVWCPWYDKCWHITSYWI